MALAPRPVSLRGRSAVLSICLLASFAPPAVAGTWTPTGPLETGRYGQTQTLLEDGRVLAAGGHAARNQYPGFDSAEILDPRTGLWSATPPLSVRRLGHTAERLPDGRVLVVGGTRTSEETGTVFPSLDSTEAFDPADGRWRPAAPMGTGRWGHSMTVLQDGTMLVAGGGLNQEQIASAEVYDPRVDRWTPVGAMATGRSFHEATLLEDGRVLVTGGCCSGPGEYLQSAEIYDPATRAWTSAGRSAGERYGHTATLLDDGTVLVVGGFEVEDPLHAVERFEPDTGEWAAAPAPELDRRGHTATPLRDGSVLVAGGCCAAPGDAPALAERFVPTADRLGAWLPAGVLAAPRHAHAATLLEDGHVVVAGGINENLRDPLRSTEVFRPLDLPLEIPDLPLPDLPLPDVPLPDLTLPEPPRLRPLPLPVPPDLAGLPARTAGARPPTQARAPLPVAVTRLADGRLRLQVPVPRGIRGGRFRLDRESPGRPALATGAYRVRQSAGRTTVLLRPRRATRARAGRLTLRADRRGRTTTVGTWAIRIAARR